VRHQLLLDEMSVGIEPARCMWLRSYLSGRIQKIRIGDAVSKDIKVTSGVPKESHLGPVYFIWFVNRISEIFVYVCVLFYVDDMKLFLPVRDGQIGATETHCSSTLVSVRHLPDHVILCSSHT
jgi:hypothetical protein